MIDIFKGVMKRESTVSRNFEYSLGKTSLKFTLRTDIKQELKDFLQCLESAVEDVKKEINKIDESKNT